MRIPTTIRAVEFFMGWSDRQKISKRQRIPQQKIAICPDPFKKRGRLRGVY